MEDDTATEVDEECAGEVINRKEEVAIRGDGKAGDVGGGLKWESHSLGFQQVYDRDAVADWGDEDGIL